jgi:hypothetical protein
MDPLIRRVLRFDRFALDLRVSSFASVTRIRARGYTFAGLRILPSIPKARKAQRLPLNPSRNNPPLDEVAG